MEDDYAIGLDLGTTFSCIGVYRNGGVEIIPNSIGEKITPSVVIFKDDEILVGEDTIEYLVKNCDSCIYAVKRLIGIDFENTKYKEEIKRLPFTVVESNKENSKENKEDTAKIEVTIKGDKKTFSPAEISSHIISKMVKNAEAYLHKKIKKLVITVPAYFGEQQKKLTKQAAELSNLEVITIINEPTAAALAYGFTKEKIENEKILVFDLGGGTFDVSILSFKKEEKSDIKYLEVISTSGDMHLGGEDFDNALVNYILNKMKDKEKIRKDNKCMKRLKLACENIKKILSTSNETVLRLANFYNGIDIVEKITKEDFENICDPLFQKLETPIKKALSDGHLIKEDIDEVILIGGSTRIPKVKDFIKKFFPKIKKINDSINPDEAVAYGATLQAEKKLYNKDGIISNLNILDITPFSLGVSVQNNSQDENIKNEGDEMSVIIKRGSILPITNTREYKTVADNQTEVLLKIYEGEKKYVKYNHLLKETRIEGLSPKPKGETKISVEFKIDSNGILYIKAIEISEKNGKQINLSIKNDEISFSNEEMEKLKKKMEETKQKIKQKNPNEDNDYTNLKDNLRTYKEAYNEIKDNDGEDEDKKLYLSNFNETLEDFIDNFDKDFDNETILEKFFLYIKELFLSYVESYKLDINKSQKNHILKKIEEYLNIFINKSSGYLNNLLDVLSSMDQKKDFYNLVIKIMKKLNQNGIDCIQKNEKFCKYNSLMYFEQSIFYYEKYLSKLKEAAFSKDSLNLLKQQKATSLDYIKNINSGAIILIEKSLKKDRTYDVLNTKFEAKGTGFTANFNILGISLKDIKDNEEKLYLAINSFEGLLSKLQTINKETSEEAKCIFKILELNNFLNRLSDKKRYFLSLAERCDLIIEHLNIKEEWCEDFSKIYKDLISMQTPREDYLRLFERVKITYSGEFEKLDNQFNKNRGKIEFIDYILKNYPYQDYKDDLEKKEKNYFKTYNNNLLTFLLSKYQPGPYLRTTNGEVNKSEYKHCLYTEISSKLSNLLNEIQN